MPVLKLAEAKSWLRVDHADDDADIESIVAAASAHLRRWTTVAVPAAPHRFEIPWDRESLLRLDVLHADPDGGLTLHPPAGASAEVSEANHRIVRRFLPSGAEIGCTVWIAAGATEDVGVEADRRLPLGAAISAGLAAADVPEDWKQAVRQVVAELYDNRAGGRVPADSAIDAIMRPLVVRRS